MWNSTHPTGFRCSTYAKPAAWFGAHSGLQKAPPPHPTQFKRTAGFHERVRALMDAADLNQKLNQTVKDSFRHSVTGCTLLFAMFYITRALAA
jgi:hypothetical protein